MTSVLELAQFLARSPRLLIVDDDIDIIESVAQLLKHYDCEVVHSTTVAEGAHRVLTERFDLVFVDLVFGQGSGIDVIQALKVRCPGTPVVLMTAFVDHPLVQEAMECGIVTLLRKPADFTLERLKELLSTFKIRAKPLTGAFRCTDSFQVPEAYPQGCV